MTIRVYTGIDIYTQVLCSCLLKAAIHSFQKIIHQKISTMKGNNTVQLIGYVGNHLRVLPGTSGKKILIRVATHDRYTKRSGEQKIKTVWHDVAAWNEVGEIAERLLVKGSHILVQGRLVYRTYMDQVGHRRYVTEIIADHIQNLDR